MLDQMRRGLYSFWRRVVGIGLLALVTTACGSPEIQPLIFGPAPWQAGEVSTFAVTDINGAYAGTARYDWSRLGDDLWGLRREISAQGTQEIIATDLREPGFRPVQSTLVRMDPSGTEQVRTSFDGSEANLELTTKQSVTTFERVSIPSDVRTQSSLVMILRALPLADNYATRLNIFNPILGQFERVTLTVEEREEVTTPAGSFSTWRVHLASPTSETDVWVAVDAPYPVIKYTESRNGGLFELSEFVPGS